MESLSFFRMRAGGSRLNLAKLVIISSHHCQRLKLRHKTVNFLKFLLIYFKDTQIGNIAGLAMMNLQ